MASQGGCYPGCHCASLEAIVLRLVGFSNEPCEPPLGKPAILLVSSSELFSSLLSQTVQSGSVSCVISPATARLCCQPCGRGSCGSKFLGSSFLRFTQWEAPPLPPEPIIATRRTVRSMYPKWGGDYQPDKAPHASRTARGASWCKHPSPQQYYGARGWSRWVQPSRNTERC